jgi:nitroreductase
MDLIQAINERFAVRAYKSDPVPLDVMKSIMQQALNAPSWANTQPWEFAVATGKPLKAIEDGYVKKGVHHNNEIARPYEFPEPYISRIKALHPKRDRGEEPREEYEARVLKNYRHYGAPACIYLLIGKNFFYESKGINAWSLYDCGAIVQNIMLLATNYGLGTVAQADAADHPDVVHKELCISDDKIVALGIAIGYPDPNDPENKKRRDKVPLEDVVKFYGFK